MTTPTQLKTMADKLRRHSIFETTKAGSGHPTSCLSCADILSVLFFDSFKKNDEFILSKGHAAPILWALYYEAGLIKKEDLKTLRKIDSSLEGHPTKRMKGVKIATGSLGQGLSAGVGMALANRIKNNTGSVYVLLGDGEIAEGSIWEAANSASYYRLENLCAIVDVNRLGQTQETMHGHDMQAYKKKFEAFGWHAIIVDGHSIRQLQTAFNTFASETKKPTVILAKTLKGKGISFLEDKNGKHGKPLSRDETDRAYKELKTTDISLSTALSKVRDFPTAPKSGAKTSYKKGEMVATREAYGKALVNAGKANQKLVVIDGDVRNSTKTSLFFEKYPKRGIEGFIAEQNMIGMALGASARGLIPVVSTFATFLTRAHDFIRMAQYSNVDLRIMGSHTGVSIGEDGPSQMGLEDLSMFLHIPGTVVLNPADAVATDALAMEQFRTKGISYLRTMRGKTPVIYKNSETFRIGGSKVLKRSTEDVAIIFATGVTVYEALTAHEKLKEEGIMTRVVDLYSLKPLDTKGIQRYAKGIQHKVVVEDNYKAELGALVASVIGPLEQLSVSTTPRSGTPEGLRRMCQIDSTAIIRTIKKSIARGRKQ